jgi:hypothetical protein
MGQEKIELASLPDVTGGIRDLIVHLHRGNGKQAESLVDQVAGRLKDIMGSGMDPQCFEMQKAQQTMFAIDEVRLLLEQRDYSGAGDAARDAGKEWNQRPK